MTGDTIKTLAEYIVKLNNANRRLERPEEYQDLVTDTNGVEQDLTTVDNHEHPGT